MRMVVQSALGPFRRKAKHHDHEVRVVGQHLPRDSLFRGDDWETDHKAYFDRPEQDAPVLEPPRCGADGLGSRG